MAAAPSASSYHIPNLYNLHGLVAVVTGGGTGIGLMIARGLAENGAKVYITGRRKEILEKVVNSGTIKGEVVALPMDVTSKPSILEAKKVLQEKEGKIHVLVNNAGQVGPISSWFNDLSSPNHKDAETLGQALFDESEQGWADLYAINVYPLFFKPGYTSSVINITSMSAMMKQAQEHFAYNAAKAAASHLTRMMATEFALKRVPVRVNAIAPGMYESEMTKDVISPEELDKMAKGVVPIPAKRPGTGEEMAGTVVYLASPSGCYANGQEIVIDGGCLAVNP
ncbi:short-chain dehydrogenase [Desarmillaria tabescens]|uniref:Short-chain dehydrogenase n=1 Tax=Armillaria tabescens TaxID=1929756 RepID=A0AA39N556_ARMTA|nr:short-chain dehydrogenase [Desarmillaria tabescens]KAK0457789.1 short-chain dehydrogenase [Desarmillaria tabescens]